MKNILLCLFLAFGIAMTVTPYAFAEEGSRTALASEYSKTQAKLDQLKKEAIRLKKMIEADVPSAEGEALLKDMDAMIRATVEKLSALNVKMRANQPATSKASTSTRMNKSGAPSESSASQESKHLPTAQPGK